MIRLLMYSCLEEVEAIWGCSHECIKTYMGISSYNLIALLLFSLLAFFAIKNRKKVINHLMGCALFIFVVGMALYLVGFWHEGTSDNLMAAIFRSATASMEMFVSESELIEVKAECKEDLLYMLLFSATHFFAICISAAFIIHIMGIRFWSYVKMSLTFRTKKDVFVFFDLSKESINLAKDIHKKKKGKHQIIFVKTPMEENHLERFSFSHILSFADNRNETIEELIGINALLTYSRKSVTIGMDENEWKQTVGLNNLRHYINRNVGNKYFFCLSSNEDNNINTAVALSKRYPKEKVYCLANRDSITDSFTNSNLKFIDSANLAVMELKKKVAYHPVSFVKPNTKMAVATKPFRSMIVGFGEIGFEVFRFLYEFSSFVGENIEENPFCCDIIDPKAKQLENSLYLHCPALEEVEKNIHNVLFHNGTIESNRTVVEKLIKKINYIVVCTDNEKENLSIGITLLNLAYKYRNFSDKLAIFIGINDNREFEKAQEIAKNYNECGQRDGNGNLYEFSIVPFGASNQIFTYKNIIGDDILKKAQSFFYEYQKTAIMLDTKNEGKLAESPQIEWYNREMNTNKDITGTSGVYYKNELQQKETQDMANAWHINTKLYLVGACKYCKDDDGCPANDRHKLLFECISTVMKKMQDRMKKARDNHEIFTKSHEFILEQIDAYEKEHNIPSGEYRTLFENLAKCEHLRWNASNRLLGYRKFENADDNQKHYLQKTHACLVSCKELVANEVLRDTIKYDYNTILVSMKM